jgi:hypothetical protein
MRFCLGVAGAVQMLRRLMGTWAEVGGRAWLLFFDSISPLETDALFGP